MATMTQLVLRAPTLTPLLDLTVDVGTPLDLGQSALGRRRMVAILGGSFEGALGRGHVLASDADWQLIVEGTTAQLDAR